MDRAQYKKQIANYKEKARKKYASLKKKYKGLNLQQRWALYLKTRKENKSWKARIRKVENKDSRKAQMKGYRLFRRLQHRKVKWAIFVVVALYIVLVVTKWYIDATRPLTAEQKVAREHALTIARQEMDESIVLLRNKGSVLPLADKKVSVFGYASARPMLGGGGAGGVSAGGAIDLFDAFDKSGIEYDVDLANVYRNFAYKNRISTDEFKKPGKNLIEIISPNLPIFVAPPVKELDVSQIPADVMDAAVKHSDTAVYTISRAGVETSDLKVEDLRLTDAEWNTLAELDKKFDHVVLLLNTTNVMELGFVEDDFKHVDSVLWVGGLGEVGAESVGKVLAGEVNPSGRLADTYAYSLETNPAVVNTGNFQYKTATGETARYFVDYEEGIYTGYRFYETFIPDKEYDKIVQYPFGYGLSYTNFKWNVVSTDITSSSIRIDVRVTNTGKAAGKEVVQLYYTAPYKSGGIEKSKVVLAGYGKTRTLQPGESQVLTFGFAPDLMASYDADSAKAWVLDAGEYKLKLARNVHDVVAEYGYHQAAKRVIRNDRATGRSITNQFDDAAGNLSVLSRSDPDETYPKAPDGDDFDLPESVVEADYKHVKSTAEGPTTAADNGIKLADLKGLDYDDPKWNDFLDQFTDKELVNFAADGGYWSIAIDRLGIPRTTMHDGPAAVRDFLGAWSTVAFPTPVNLATTWNDALAEEVGKAMGAEAVAYGVDAAYAPSLNMHRSPLGGRNFEYYSEDPLIAGRIGAAVTRGMQSQGLTAVMKHFAANDQETNRAAYGLYTWVNEQSLREIYLKPFEYAVKEGGARGAMTAFNRVGAIWAGGSKALLTDVLRNEWGFEGFVITDACVGPQGTHCDPLQAVEAGNDMMLVMWNTSKGQLEKYLKDDRAGTLSALRNAAHNISYYVLHTKKI